MLKFNSADEALIDYSYKAFLRNIKQFFENNEINTALHCYIVLKEMLRTGVLSIDTNIVFDDEYRYLKIPMNNLGIHVMYGVCCCRHVSALIKDVLNVLNFNASLYYIFIDANGLWHSSTPLKANHVSVLVKDGDNEFILEPISNVILKKATDGSFLAIDLDNSILDAKQFNDYSDCNIENIGRVLRKYYNIQASGITQVYEY